MLLFKLNALWFGWQIAFKSLSFLQLVSQWSYHFGNLWNLYRIESNWKNEIVWGKRLRFLALSCFLFYVFPWTTKMWTTRLPWQLLWCFPNYGEMDPQSMSVALFFGQTFCVGIRKKIFNPLINIDCDYFGKLCLEG